MDWQHATMEINRPLSYGDHVRRELDERRALSDKRAQRVPLISRRPCGWVLPDGTTRAVPGDMETIESWILDLIDIAPSKGGRTCICPSLCCDS